MSASTNADGLSAIELSEEQRYVFDTRGWLCIPAVLGAGDIDEMRDFAYRLAREPDSIPAHARSSIGGPLQRLMDHPVVIGFMNRHRPGPG